MKTILWFGLVAGCLTIIGGILGYRPLIAAGSFCLLLALFSAAFSDRAGV
ncbi:hypothetical protein BH23GEM10_BH23GEM10_02790 [soil metagenome]